MKVIVTGAAGLIGRHVCVDMLSRQHTVIGIDNDSRQTFFGKEGSTARVVSALTQFSNYTHFNTNIADAAEIQNIFYKHKADLVVHAAAQPSHDAAAKFPLLDATTNVMGTLSVLEAVRNACPAAVFVYLSTNKVYGDHPNRVRMFETDTRYDYVDLHDGIDESMKIFGGVHSVFGVAKLSAEAYVTEYGTNFGLKTCSLRGGCLTGPGHMSVELHGFLSYIIKCALTDKQYTIYGYKGKQVRDQLHAADVADLIRILSVNTVLPGSVFNIGGGRDNSASILETIDLIKSVLHKDLRYTYCDQARVGDHICYITNNSAITKATGWTPSRSLKVIISDIAKGFKDE
jgi:CDP-paratose 2-epimerase